MSTPPSKSALRTRRFNRGPENDRSWQDFAGHLGFSERGLSTQLSRSRRVLRTAGMGHNSPSPRREQAGQKVCHGGVWQNAVTRRGDGGSAGPIAIFCYVRALALVMRRSRRWAARKSRHRAAPAHLQAHWQYPICGAISRAGTRNQACGCECDETSAQCLVQIRD